MLLIFVGLYLQHENKVKKRIKFNQLCYKTYFINLLLRQIKTKKHGADYNLHL